MATGGSRAVRCPRGDSQNWFTTPEVVRPEVVANRVLHPRGDSPQNWFSTPEVVRQRQSARTLVMSSM